MDKKIYEIQIENANVCGQVINGTIEVEFDEKYMEFYTDETEVTEQLGYYDEWIESDDDEQVEWVEFFQEVVGTKMRELAESLYPDEEWIFWYSEGLTVELVNKESHLMAVKYQDDIDDVIKNNKLNNEEGCGVCPIGDLTYVVEDNLQYFDEDDAEYEVADDICDKLGENYKCFWGVDDNMYFWDTTKYMKDGNKKPSFIEYVKENGCWCNEDGYPPLEDFAEWDDKKNAFVGIENKGIYRDIEGWYYTWDALIKYYKDYGLTILNKWGEIIYTTEQDGLDEYLEEWLENNPEYAIEEGDDDFAKFRKREKLNDERLNYLGREAQIYRYDGLNLKRH